MGKNGEKKKGRGRAASRSRRGNLQKSCAKREQQAQGVGGRGEEGGGGRGGGGFATWGGGGGGELGVWGGRERGMQTDVYKRPTRNSTEKLLPRH